MARTLAAARVCGWLLAVSHVGLALLVLFVANKTTPLNFLSLNVADNVLHVLIILAGLVIALLPARRALAPA